MELKILPIFSPKSPSCPRPATEIRFSRWNNANAQKFIRRERVQKEIEDDIRRERRYQSAAKIAENYDYATDHNENSLPEFRSFGTPSSPSLPSIPGKASKYSRNPNENPRDSNPKISHPAFRRFSRVSRVPPVGPGNGIVVSHDGVSYRVPNAPFEFQYSYTETPKVKPLAVREPPYAPFGPATMPRPWTGRAPLPPSKKKLPEFDSFRLPPPGKKGVKPVQAPGPFLQGSGPKYVKSREEILGEPLTEEEKKELIKANLRARRQLNMGRDGLTHNMLDNIHALWKRRRVCKIKCKGVCTVDMDNVRQQLEEKTGGKVIYSRGGVIFIFRGRNYNFRTRPKFPLMLWKPVSPVYPRLIQRAPEGLTLEEASNMRKRGRKLSPICKLGKNGVYCDLVKNVREAFEECELVRVNCQGMNKSDYKKIGAKLKDLVPCVLISFEYEHILMWRGRDWKYSLPKPEKESDEAPESTTDGATCSAISGEHQETSDLVAVMSSNPYEFSEMPNPGISFGEKVVLEMKDGTTASLALAGEHGETSDLGSVMISNPDEYSGMPNTSISRGEEDVGLEMKDSSQLENSNQILTAINGSTPTTDGIGGTGESSAMPNDLESCTGSVAILDRMVTRKELAATSQVPLDPDEPVSSSESSLCHCQVQKGPNRTCTEGVLMLRRQAIESGSALFLDDDSLDANVVFERAIALAKTAPPEPTFTRRVQTRSVQKASFQKVEKQESEDSEVEEIVSLVERRVNEKKGSKNKRRKDFTDACPDVVPHGSLRVDELAKLLA